MKITVKWILIATFAILASTDLIVSMGMSAQFCRLRLTNLSAETTTAVLNDASFTRSLVLIRGAGVLQEEVTLRWAGIVIQEPGMLEIMYGNSDYVEGDRIMGIMFPNLPATRNLQSGQLNMRCSVGAITNNTDSIDVKFIKSFLVNLGTPMPVQHYLHRSATFQEQTNLDCYLREGYTHPYTLAEYPRYVADGDEVNFKCQSIGKCEDGRYAAVSRCPVTFKSGPVAMVRKVGQCCEEAAIKDDVEQQDCPKDEHGSAFENVESKDFLPWQVRFRARNMGWICDGVIIERNFFISTKLCLSNPQNLELIRPFAAAPASRNITITEVRDVGNGLALARLSLPFVDDDWTTAIQNINLPWSRSVCEKLLEPGCHVAVGLDQWDEFYDPSAMVGTVAETGSKVSRIQKTSDKSCRIGSGVVGWYGKINFIVGIYVRNQTLFGLETESVDNLYERMDDWDTGDLINVCQSLEQIIGILDTEQ